MKESSRQQASYFTYRGLAAALQVFPDPLADVIATAAGFAMSEIWRDKRPVVRANLRRVLGPGADDATVDRAVKKAFDSYAHYWVEAARVGALRSDKLEARFSVDGFEPFRQEMARDRGVVLALPHVGSWESGGRWLAQQGYPMTTVGELLEPPELFEWFTAQRAALGLTVLPPGRDTTVRLLETLRSGRVVGLLADRDIAGNGVQVEFFGEKTTLPAGPALIALRARVALMPCVIYQRPGGRFHAVILPALASERTGKLRDDIQRLTAELALAMEKLIRAAPEQWHMFQPNWPSDKERFG